MSWRPVFAVGVILSIELTPSHSAAAEAPPCEPGRPWILLRVEPPLRAVHARLADQVRESLAARGVEVCLSEVALSTAPLATLEVGGDEAETATTIVVDDGVTRKHVRRAIDLRGVPPDGRSLVIAVALDELLRASWAELLLHDHPPITPPPPPLVTAALSNEAAPVSRTAPRWEVSVAFAGEHFGAGHDQLGVDASVAAFPFSSFGIQLRGGVRAGLTVAAASGDLRSNVVVGALGGRLALTPREAGAGVDLLVEGSLYRVAYEAIALEPRGVRGREAAALAGYAQLAARGWYVLTPSFRASAQAGLGLPLEPVQSVLQPGRRGRRDRDPRRSARRRMRLRRARRSGRLLRRARPVLEGIRAGSAAASGSCSTGTSDACGHDSFCPAGAGCQFYVAGQKNPSCTGTAWDLTFDTPCAAATPTMTICDRGSGTTPTSGTYWGVVQASSLQGKPTNVSLCKADPSRVRGYCALDFATTSIAPGSCKSVATSTLCPGVVFGDAGAGGGDRTTIQWNMPDWPDANCGSKPKIAGECIDGNNFTTLEERALLACQGVGCGTGSGGPAVTLKTTANGTSACSPGPNVVTNPCASNPLTSCQQDHRCEAASNTCV